MLNNLTANKRFSFLTGFDIIWRPSTYLSDNSVVYAARIEDKHMIHRAGVLYLSDAWLHCIYILPSESSSVHGFNDSLKYISPLACIVCTCMV